jgi:uncharacterized repeat protein (TIGR01451 family)
VFVPPTCERTLESAPRLVVRRLRLSLVLTASLIGVAGILTLLLTLKASPRVLEAGPAAVLTVCMTGQPACDYARIQEAVDEAAPGDVIKVAAGVYTGVHLRPAPADYPHPPAGGLIAQVVYVSKTITIRGGYTITNWITPDLISNPTVVDAMGQGRALVMCGIASPSVEGLHLTGGNAAGLGGYAPPDDFDDAGGGVYVAAAAASLQNNWVFSNAAPFGGGVYLAGAPATLEWNTVYANTAHDGAGIYLYYSDATLDHNTVVGNVAHDGGGVFLYESDATLFGNTVSANRADDDVGGLAIFQSGAAVMGNIITGNSARDDGGGIGIKGSEGVTLTGNVVLSNTTAGEGGGLFIDGCHATMVNNVVANNRAHRPGSGFYVQGDSLLHLLHNTVAGNHDGSGDGIHLVDGSTVVLTNTVLVSHTVGVNVAAGSTATLEATLWGGGAWANGVDWSGSGVVITGTVNVWGDPAFVDPDAGDYHVSLGSAVVDAGVKVSVYQDIDGHPRPVGMRPDVGAHEFPMGLWVTKSADPNPVQAGDRLTYTIDVSNNGLFTLTALITDTLPDQVAPAGALTWSLDPMPPGTGLEALVVVTVVTDHSGLITNMVQVSTQEGVTAMSLSRVAVLGQVVYLPIVRLDG